MMNAKETHALANRELEACLARIQERLGVTTGDFAGTYFTGKNKTWYNHAVGMLADYIEAENRWNEPDEVPLRELRLKQTCGACPEQYDVFDGEKLVGYLRVRHGHFQARYGGGGGPVVYEAFVHGDGMFENSEREYHLKQAESAIRAKIAAPKGER